MPRRLPALRDDLSGVARSLKISSHSSRRLSFAEAVVWGCKKERATEAKKMAGNFGARGRDERVGAGALAPIVVIVARSVRIAVGVGERVWREGVVRPMVISREHDPAGLGASVGDVLGTFLHQPEQGDTSRETTFHPMAKKYLVPV